MLPALGMSQAGPGGRPRTGPLLFDPLNDEEGPRRGTRVRLLIKQNFPQSEWDRVGAPCGLDLKTKHCCPGEESYCPNPSKMTL